MRAIIMILLAATVAAEQKREADPSYSHGLTHGSSYGHGLTHGYTGYGPSHRLGSGIGYSQSGYSYGTSHPSYGYPSYRPHGYGRGYSGHPSHATAYSTPNSYVSVHRVHKREADPEPAAEADPSYGYGHHSGYGSPYFARGYVAPRVHGATSYVAPRVHGATSYVAPRIHGATSYVGPRVHGARLGYTHAW